MNERIYEKVFIGGEWVVPKGDQVLKSIDPSTEYVWAEIALPGKAEVDMAVAAARAALRGSWSKFSATRRGELLAKLANLIRRDAAVLAELESRDNGKPLRDTRGEIDRAADWITFFAGAADKINGEQIPYRPDALAYTRREPIGVVAAILPWNSPISMYAWKLGPALAAGNAIIIKPAEQTSVTAMEIAKLIEEAGFPEGVVSVLPGYGAEVGAALAAHPDVNKIAFTGEHSTAQQIMRAAAGNLKRCTFECGGKSPHIIFEDADLERALQVAMHSAFRSTGQSCSLGSRLFVQRPIYERFQDQIAALAGKIRVGAPLDPATHIGPHTSAEQLAKTMKFIALGQEEGARLIAGGGRPLGLDRGYYVQPTVFADVDNRSALAQQEVFGPVLSMIPFDTEEEVLAMANDTQYGLVAGLWTSDVTRAHRIAHQIEAGLVSVNTYRPVHFMLPYGGYKLSGIGRENGLDVINHYTEVKTVVVNLSETPEPSPFDGI
ncbi:aldehyde dehydrogenase [Agaricicola taiwanensis]|uniref:Aldehyde dehydrogenase n=1 Tax=Agaricicola taiwanensis TaxID=591372 RepID=A0A8J2YJU4_9RHOB|nr:aldehyde dehydrogenase [Agaricicola taiwanensis]GGE48560.1 aldehyde dehydrogenase [Agaricicola taiwanensis]